MKLHGWLFKRVLRLDMDGSGPPWPLQLYNRESDAFEEVGRGSMQLLDEVIVPTGGAATIDFASIPNRYRSLRLEALAKSTSAVEFDLMYVKVNGDSTAAHYIGQGLYWSNAPDEASSNAAPTAAGAYTGWVMGSTTAHPDAWNCFEIDLPRYSGTLSQKCLKAHVTGAPNYASVASALFANYWLSTAAINALSLSLTSGDFAAGSTASLYGIV